MPMRVGPPRLPSRADRRGTWRRATFASLDFETTGLDYRRDDIVSFGVVPVRAGRVVLREAVHQLVAPGVPVSPASLRIHQLLPGELASAPSLSGARGSLSDALAGRFVLAWFAELEIAFLARTFGNSRRSWRRRTIDVRRLALAVEGMAPDSRVTLTAAAERVGVPVVSPHDALDDALVASQLFLVLAARFERAGIGRVVDLLDVCAGGRRALRLERRVRAAV
jgi:DNA polymerase III subunit epsilon